MFKLALVVNLDKTSNSLFLFLVLYFNVRDDSYDTNIWYSKKKKKFKINWVKVFVWIALIAMVGSAFAAILSPLFYN